MASGNMLVHSQRIQDPQAELGYEAASYVIPFKSDLGEFHLIIYAGDPTNKFANAPNGSLSIDPTAHHTYTKVGAIGSGIAGAWAVNT